MPGHRAMAFASSPLTSLHSTPPPSSPTFAGSLQAVNENGLLTDKKRNIGTNHEIIIGRDKSKCDGDRLRLSSKTTLIFQAARQIDPQHFDLHQERDMRAFSDQYVVTDRLLGSGAFGKAYMAIEQITRTQLACKIVDLRVIGPKTKTRSLKDAPIHAREYDVKAELKKVQAWGNQKKREVPIETKLSIYYREFKTLSSLSHPNIIALDKVYITNSSLYIFQDLLSAGDLYSYLSSKNNNLLEVEAAAIVWQILMAVQFLHERDIVHRDLKPENIMMTSLTTGARVVLTNFGSARKVIPFQKTSTMAGSKQYKSTKTSGPPSEALGDKGGNYSLATDMWSVGGVAALLLVGILISHVYTGQDDARLAASVSLTMLEKSARWTRLGERPKSFIRALLVTDEDDRITAKESFDHAWFSNAVHKTDFKDLYQRTIKHVRPRVSSVPVVEFVQGNSRSMRYLKCSRQFLNEHETQPRDFPRSRNVPVEPPYKPFPRKMHEQGGLWPKRRRTRSMSEEAAEAIANDWSSDSTKRTDPPSQGVAVALSRRFKKPTVPPLVRSVTSGKRSSSLSGLHQSLRATGKTGTSDSDFKVSASAAIVPGLQLAEHPATPYGADGSRIYRRNSDIGTSAAQGTRGQRSPASINPLKVIETPDQRNPASDSTKTNQTSHKTSHSDNTPIPRGRSITKTFTSSQIKSSVALNVQSRTKLRSRSRSRSTDSSMLSTPSRKRKGSLYNYDVDDNVTDDRGKMKHMWEGLGRARKDKLKDSLDGVDHGVWTHEEYLRMTDEDMEQM